MFTSVISLLTTQVPMQLDEICMTVSSTRTIAAARITALPQNYLFSHPEVDAVINGTYDANYMVWSNKLPSHKVITFIGDNMLDLLCIAMHGYMHRQSLKILGFAG